MLETITPTLIPIVISLLLTISLFIVVIIFFVKYHNFRHRIDLTIAGLKSIIQGNKNVSFAASKDTTLSSLSTSLNEIINTFEARTEAVEKTYATVLYEKNTLSSIISNANMGIIGLDSKHQILVFNKMAEKLLGINPQEAFGKNISQVFTIYNKDGEIPELVYCPSTGYNDNVQIFSESSLKLTTFKGKDIIVNFTAVPIHDEKSPLECIVRIEDTTNKSQLENMKLDFVSMAAHELRTPLTSIKGYLSVFIKENQTKLSADQMMLIERVDNSAKQLTDLVENLLNVSRIERGALSVNIQPINWLDLVKETVNEFIDKAREKQIILSFTEPQQSIPDIQADKLKISEVLNNFISNAIKYTQPGGKVNVWVELKGNDVVTHVTDTGQGIPKEAQPYLFSKFFRVNNVMQQSLKGNGLGLYIAKAIVDIHHGKVWVDSEVGKGSTFSFSVPI